MATTRMSALDKLSDDDRKALERQAGNICGLFSKREIEFVLRGPEKLAVLSKGQYTMRPFIGEEKLVGQSAYVGKSAKVIVQFREISTSGEIVEMPLLDMTRKVEGFSAFTHALAEHVEDQTMESIREESAQIERRAHVEAARAMVANPAFGSW